MEAPERSEQFPWQHAAAMFVVAAGILLIGLSLVWTRLFTGHSAWPQDKAVRYQSAASRLHELSMQAAAASSESQTKEAKELLIKAESEYAQLRSELDTVRARPGQISHLLRYAGAALLLGGIVTLLARR